MIDLIRESIAGIRDEIIFGEPYNPKKYPGGCRSFDKLTLEQIGRLEELDILDMSEAQNDSPSIGGIIEFLRARDTDGWYVHGYCVSPDRSDFRVSFEGVGKEMTPTMKDLYDFTCLFRFADEFSADEDGLWCWYD